MATVKKKPAIEVKVSSEGRVSLEWSDAHHPGIEWLSTTIPEGERSPARIKISSRNSDGSYSYFCYRDAHAVRRGARSQGRHGGVRGRQGWQDLGERAELRDRAPRRAPPVPRPDRRGAACHKGPVPLRRAQACPDGTGGRAGGAKGGGWRHGQGRRSRDGQRCAQGGAGGTGSGASRHA